MTTPRPRSELWADPRPDLRADHALWELLLKACMDHPLANGEPLQSLRAFRSLGAQLSWDGRRLKMAPGPEYLPEEYAADRIKYLAPMTNQLRIVFEAAGQVLAKGAR